MTSKFIDILFLRGLDMGTSLSSPPQSSTHSPADLFCLTAIIRVGGGINDQVGKEN